MMVTELATARRSGAFAEVYLVCQCSLDRCFGRPEDLDWDGEASGFTRHATLLYRDNVVCIALWVYPN
jgi:hypothetical protein